jgi:hypothetical protein
LKLLLGIPKILLGILPKILLNILPKEYSLTKILLNILPKEYSLTKILLNTLIVWQITLFFFHGRAVSSDDDDNEVGARDRSRNYHVVRLSSFFFHSLVE